jgi:hypothetical protein
LRDERQDAFARARLADDIESAVLFEAAFDAGEDQTMVIRDYDLQHRGISIVRTGEVLEGWTSVPFIRPVGLGGSCLLAA